MKHMLPTLSFMGQLWAEPGGISVLGEFQHTHDGCLGGANRVEDRLRRRCIGQVGPVCLGL